VTNIRQTHINDLVQAKIEISARKAGPEPVFTAKKMFNNYARKCLQPECVAQVVEGELLINNASEELLNGFIKAYSGKYSLEFKVVYIN